MTWVVWGLLYLFLCCVLGAVFYAGGAWDEEDEMPRETDFATGTWAIVELMGHLRVSGYVTEEEHFGVKLGRVDVPYGDQYLTQYFSGDSLFRLTPVEERVARAAAKQDLPAPIRLWEMKALTGHAPTPADDYLTDDDDDEEYDEDDPDMPRF